METKNVVIGLFGLAIVGGVAWYVWNEKRKTDGLQPSGGNAYQPGKSTNSSGLQPGGAEPGTPNAKPETVTANNATPPKVKTGTVKSPVDKPAATAPSAKVNVEAVVKAKGDAGLHGLNLFAKSSTGGIYTTTLKKVGTMTAGELLGEAFKSMPTKNGLLIKYQTPDGEYRVVAAAAVDGMYK